VADEGLDRGQPVGDAEGGSDAVEDFRFGDAVGWRAGAVACTKLRWRTASGPTICMAAATALAMVR
jgi:hypothetical protein